MLNCLRLIFSPSFLWIYEVQQKVPALSFQIRVLCNESSSKIFLKEEKGTSETTSILVYYE